VIGWLSIELGFAIWIVATMLLIALVVWAVASCERSGSW